MPAPGHSKESISAKRLTRSLASRVAVRTETLRSRPVFVLDKISWADAPCMSFSFGSLKEPGIAFCPKGSLESPSHHLVYFRRELPTFNPHDAFSVSAVSLSWGRLPTCRNYPQAGWQPAPRK